LEEDDLQFAAMLCITLTLFGGILLKTDTQDEDPYGAAVMSGLLMGINVGIVILFVFQAYVALKTPKNTLTLTLFCVCVCFRLTWR